MNINGRDYDPAACIHGVLWIRCGLIFNQWGFEKISWLSFKIIRWVTVVVITGLIYNIWLVFLNWIFARTFFFSIHTLHSAVCFNSPRHKFNKINVLLDIITIEFICFCFCLHISARHAVPWKNGSWKFSWSLSLMRRIIWKHQQKT